MDLQFSDERAFAVARRVVIGDRIASDDGVGSLGRRI
jgi:hypothetical protein